jgi:ribosomal protein L35AE/L33A
MTSAICFIEKKRKQRRMQPNGALWESGDWDVSEKRAPTLVGKRIYFHEKQAEASYFGGTITGYRVLPHDHETPGRIVFSFTADAEGRGFNAGPSGWRNDQKAIP